MSRITADPGVPLAHYRQHRADVLLLCEGCVYTQVVPLEAVIARLTARGYDGERVGIRKVADLTTRACPRCGSARWTSRPAFPSIPGQDGITRTS